MENPLYCCPNCKKRKININYAVLSIDDSLARSKFFINSDNQPKFYVDIKNNRYYNSKIRVGLICWECTSKKNYTINFLIKENTIIKHIKKGKGKYYFFAREFYFEDEFEKTLGFLSRGIIFKNGVNIDEFSMFETLKSEFRAILNTSSVPFKRILNSYNKRKKEQPFKKIAVI